MASIIAMEPDVVVLDEPTTGQDYLGIKAIRTAIKKLKDQGKTVIVVSHDMPLVAEDTDRVLVMCDTELIFDGTPSKLFASKEILSKTNLLPPQITSFTQKVGFLFGSEASGLSNNEISYSNYVLQIPTNTKFKSLNLSHSLIIVAHTVFDILKLKKINYSESKKIKSATKKDLQDMANLCIKHLNDINFFKPKEKKPIMMENLRTLFYKLDLSQKETRILSSVFASLAKKKVD